jgi:photosystem II stability/assembly factor-like uncharacterized protein
MHWQQSTLNGGGFITGLMQDPHAPEILYARSDVGGIFQSSDGGQSWRALNHGMTDCHQHDVQSFAISPHDHNLLFRCSGSVRGDTFFGTTHKSVDGGAFWTPVTREVDFYGNGETRFYGEVIAVDPHDPACVMVGGYTAGVWISTDTGDHWTYIGLKGERISCVCFHPLRKDVVYIGTIGSYDRDPVFVAQQHDVIRPNPARLYGSADRGATWEILHEGMDVAEIAFDSFDPDVLHAACINDGIQKSVDGGRTWVNHAPNLSKYPIGTLTIDPKNPQRLYAAAGTLPNYDMDVPPIGLYRSDDGGDSWALVRWHTEADLRNYPSYMTLPYAGWAISKVRVDARDSDTLFISNWYGVATSHDGGQTWDAHGFRGMENVCIESITAHPAQPNTVYIVPADHNPKVSTDGGQTFASLPRPEVEKPQPDSTAIVASRFRPDLVIYGIKGSGGCSIVVAQADGSNPRVVHSMFSTLDTAEWRIAFQSRAAAVSVQALAEDPFTPGTFYAYLDGIIECGAGVWRSTDWGEHWAFVANPFPAHIGRVPYQREWIECELLSVVIAQPKNVCGTNQLLCVDPHRAGMLYLGEWTEGLFRSTNHGATWKRIGKMLPFGRDRASVLNVIRTDAQQPGVLYTGFIREGVWRSRDYGDTWEKLFPFENRIFNATSIASGGADGKTLVVACEPLYYAPCESALWVSQDSGQTWQNVYDPRLGAIRWKGVALEPGADFVYAASCGNSVFYLDLDQG